MIVRFSRLQEKVRGELVRVERGQVVVRASARIYRFWLSNGQQLGRFPDGTVLYELNAEDRAKLADAQVMEKLSRRRELRELSKEE